MNNFNSCEVITIISDDKIKCICGSIGATQATEVLSKFKLPHAPNKTRSLGKILCYYEIKIADIAHACKWQIHIVKKPL